MSPRSATYPVTRGARRVCTFRDSLWCSSRRGACGASAASDWLACSFISLSSPGTDAINASPSRTACRPRPKQPPKPDPGRRRLSDTVHQFQMTPWRSSPPILGDSWMRGMQNGPAPASQWAPRLPRVSARQHPLPSNSLSCIIHKHHRHHHSMGATAVVLHAGAGPSRPRAPEASKAKVGIDSERRACTSADSRALTCR